MEVLILTTFVSLVLALAGVGLFVWSARSRTFDHADRLALLPLGDGRTARHETSTPKTSAVAHEPQEIR